MLPPDSLSGSRATKQPCEVCQTFAPDDSGRCPLCAPHSPGRSGDVVDDLVAQRERRDGAA